MNLAIRKLAMLEKEMKAKEELARIEGFTTCPVDSAMMKNITGIMDKIRAL